MDNTPISDALALRATASAFDAQRGKLPVPGDPHRSPDAVAVARQISELGKLITDLGDEVLFRAVSQAPGPHTARVVASFAAAVEPAGEAASALGAVAHQLAFLNQTESLRDQPDARDAREAAVRVMEEALATAGAALHDGANSLHSASATVSPPSARLQAARSRSATTARSPGSPPPNVATAVAAPSDRIARGR
ncbi:hypothetical protein [Streptomyces caniscabiei]|uniref:Uncharacterized protein n=1 Tax=Streptomyces caniscabiei TaxID=2746961 RepID=A0ABU4MZR3_9ACTN|nr:hypothetical protein [Streptomyces caniscabiei]MBE4741477.1 hypothetical protein [Streptomyces caniscabiei]MBE4761549.1 hypothetical protein [Streptomyces caniscabiei]MBE4790039.1 hypothetical protein [Streptomyces caniscabiei]MBE4799198.1 hypothetical protein [Streptomyces caniscabiei]MDX2947615.1 hypothetical protein [Streptomyces caniscabiei]